MDRACSGRCGGARERNQPVDETSLSTGDRRSSGEKCQPAAGVLAADEPDDEELDEESEDEEDEDSFDEDESEFEELTVLEFDERESVA
jgi:hypothetical protein